MPALHVIANPKDMGNLSVMATSFGFKTRFSFRTLLILIISVSLVSGCANRKNRDRDLSLNQQVEDLYDRAKRAMDNGNYFIALDYYRLLEANFPYGRITEQTKLDIIYALDKTNQVEEAIDAADNFIELYPTHANVDYAYYMKGVASFEKKSGRIDAFIRGTDHRVRDPKPLRDAEAAFLELIQRFPDSDYADDARQRIIFLRNRLAERELEVAKFYYENRTYVAAVNRCKHVIYQYETSPAIEGALLLMEQSYREMGLTDLAASTRDVLILNFPQYANQNARTSGQKRGFLSRILGSKDSGERSFDLPEFQGEGTVSNSKEEKPGFFERWFKRSDD